MIIIFLERLIFFFSLLCISWDVRSMPQKRLVLPLPWQYECVFP